MDYSGAQAANSALNQVSKRPTGVPSPSASDNLGGAIESATRLHMKLDALEERLFGSSPAGDAEKATTPEALAWKANHLNSQVAIADARLASILDRL